MKYKNSNNTYTAFREEGDSDIVNSEGKFHFSKYVSMFSKDTVNIFSTFNHAWKTKNIMNKIKYDIMEYIRL